VYALGLTVTSRRFLPDNDVPIIDFSLLLVDEGGKVVDAVADADVDAVVGAVADADVDAVIDADGIVPVPLAPALTTLFELYIPFRRCCDNEDPLLLLDLGVNSASPRTMNDRSLGFMTICSTTPVILTSLSIDP
jgi:hypothetical protein